MIVANGNVSDATTFKFSYNINIPENIDYANIAKAVYGVYYNNDSGESIRSDDGYCVIGRWRGFVEFTTYGEVWRLVE